MSTDGGVTGNVGGYGGTDGSTVTSNAFAVTSAGSALTFAFDFVTSDGTITFPDYAWANLYNASDNSLVATLFTATTNPSGSTVPGIGAGLPAISATITPNNASVFTGPGSTVWSPLGASSGTCYIDYTQGCGNTGWVGASYNVLSPGNYYLTFGVANAGDQAFDTGMAFVGTAIGGVPIEDEDVAVPEPTTIVLMAIGLAALATRRRSLISNNINGFLRA
ncbi:MAG: NF038132 family protein [Methylococcales bacterium]|nr:NF038132 family protein [Methylococcales bacterium]